MECIESLFGAIEIEVPDSGDMLEANRLQREQPLDPFDSIGLSIILVNSAIPVSRDDEFMELAKKAELNRKLTLVDLLFKYGKVYHVDLKDHSMITEVPKKVRDLEEKLGLNIFPN
ncbi:MAG: hypothetical protein ISS94_03065 [Candidatus Syntrophoarchaeum sp.]|nr:hypothetical protein [Methanomicrobia archaeon]MBL7117750.1 hypothetical protein [Candidatus Syntrophoarchaeum sp.]